MYDWRSHCGRKLFKIYAVAENVDARRLRYGTTGCKSIHVRCKSLPAFDGVARFESLRIRDRGYPGRGFTGCAYRIVKQPDNIISKKAFGTANARA